jgi:hypothetical protein
MHFLRFFFFLYLDANQDSKYNHLFVGNKEQIIQDSTTQGHLFSHGWLQSRTYVSSRSKTLKKALSDPFYIRYKLY